MTDISQRRAHLLQRLNDLQERIREVAMELESPKSTDWEDSAKEREDDEMLERLGLNSKAEIQQIKAALARIDDGQYGSCLRCGAEISAERLDILPATPLCRRCAT